MEADAIAVRRQNCRVVLSGQIDERGFWFDQGESAAMPEGLPRFVAWDAVRASWIHSRATPAVDCSDRHCPGAI